MIAAHTYINKIEQLIEKFKRTEIDPIAKSAQIIVNSITSGGWLYVFGTGHSHMVALEFFYRAGGLARVRPILDSKLMLHESASKSSALERVDGYASKVLERYSLTSRDVLLIASNSGRNAVPIEMALAAKKLGVKVITLTSMKHTESVVSRHISGKKLYEISDIVIDNCGEIGDACMDYMDTKVAPTSTIMNSLIIESIVAEVAHLSQLESLGVEFFVSANGDDGERLNKALMEKYHNSVREL